MTLLLLLGLVMVVAAILLVSMALSGSTVETRGGVGRALEALEAMGQPAPKQLVEDLDRPLKSYMSWVKYVLRQYGFYLLEGVRI